MENNSKVTIEDALRIKSSIEKDIINLLDRYKKETGLDVVSVEIITKYMNDGGKPRLWDVSLKVEL